MTNSAIYKAMCLTIQEKIAEELSLKTELIESGSSYYSYYSIVYNGGNMLDFTLRISSSGIPRLTISGIMGTFNDYKFNMYDVDFIPQIIDVIKNFGYRR